MRPIDRRVHRSDVAGHGETAKDLLPTDSLRMDKARAGWRGFNASDQVVSFFRHTPCVVICYALPPSSWCTTGRRRRLKVLPTTYCFSSCPG